MKKGKLYFGVCDGCYTKDAASAYEVKIRTTADDLAKPKSVKALVENFRDELSGGEKILLDKAFSAAMDKPRRFTSSNKHRDVEEERKNIVELRRKMEKVMSDAERLAERNAGFNDEERNGRRQMQETVAFSSEIPAAMLGATSPQEETAQNTKRMSQILQRIEENGGSGGLKYR